VAPSNPLAPLRGERDGVRGSKMKTLDTIRFLAPLKLTPLQHSCELKVLSSPLEGLQP